MYWTDYTLKGRISGASERRHYLYADIFMIAGIALIYALNGAVLKPYTSGMFNYFAVCYLNDIMAPCFVLSYINIFAGTAGLRLRGFALIETMAVTMGLFWETASPILKPGAVADPLDVAACALGGIIYWAVSRRLDNKF
jgi:hypothetical protein